MSEEQGETVKYQEISEDELNNDILKL
jgi:hypothetical protein